MAAHMHRAVRLPCIRYDFARISWRKDVLACSLVPKYFSTSPNNSDLFKGLLQGSGKALSESPNQTKLQGKSAINLQNSDEKSGTSLGSPVNDTPLSFATLFRQSNFVHLGNAKGKVVFGKIYRVVSDDLYIDFGWKFPCVVKRPTEDAHLYVNEASVRLRIIDLEMSTIFLGATKETSLNEANCILLGLINSPLGRPQARSTMS